MSNYFDMTMLSKIILFSVLQSKEIISADVLIDNHEITNCTWIPVPYTIK